jgi:DNA-directed RNA polymerase subunit RPC12/RpoP
MINLETCGIELAKAIQKTATCQHEFIVTVHDEFTEDARKIKKEYIRCKYCNYYKVKVLYEEPVKFW